MSEKNKALVRRMFEEAYNANNLAVVEEVIAKTMWGTIPAPTKREVLRRSSSISHATMLAGLMP